MNLCRTDSGSNPETASAPCGCGLAPHPGFPLAIAAVPIQSWETPYDGERALMQGTIFPSLDLPFYLAKGGTVHG